MLFPTHLVAAYLIGRPRDLSVPWIVAGAALPDLIDKTLATVGVAELYHTIGHSLIALAALAVVASRGRRWLALGIGWGSHLVLDAIQMAINGRPEDVRFLLWPFVRHVPAVQLPPVEFAVYYVGTHSFFVEVGIWMAFASVLIRGRFSST